MNKIDSQQCNRAQPKALAPMFLIEIWERFGFYAVQTVLVLYLTKIYHLSDDNAYDLFAITAAFMYATPFLGGYLADRVLGYRNAIICGSLLLAVGYWLLMLPGLHIFYWGIAFIIVGNGFFKSNVSTLVGLLYTEDDPRRDGGFTIFYMGINIGSFLGPLAAGYISTYFGWPAVFGASGAGLIIALLIALFTFRMLGDIGLPPVAKKVLICGQHYSAKVLAAIGVVCAITLFGWLISNHELANLLFIVICAAAVIGVIILALKCRGQERNNMLILIILLFFSIIWWSIYNQTFSSLNLFTDRIVNRYLFGSEVPTAVFQSINPFFIVVLTPVFVKLWGYVDRSNHWLSTSGAKFTVALVLMGLAYAVLIIGMIGHGSQEKVNMFWLNGSYFLQTVAELCLSPIGLSLASELAPAQYRGMMMGAWMLSISAGYALGDYFSKLSSIPAQLVHTAPAGVLEHFYGHAFSIYMWMSFIAALSLWALTPFLNRRSRKRGI